KGCTAPAKRPSKWARSALPDYFRLKPGDVPRSRWRRQFWCEALRNRIAGQVGQIRHWKLIEGDWSEAPDVDAHWHIDPPYAKAGKHYKYNEVDFEALAKWCRERQGYVQVCENYGASWLPFKPYHLLTAIKGGHRKGWSHEAVFQQGDVGFDADY